MSASHLQPSPFRSAAGQLSVRVWAASVQYLITVPLKAGSFCSSLLLLRLKREEICLLSFLTGACEPGCFPFSSCVVGGTLLLAFLLALCRDEEESHINNGPAEREHMWRRNSRECQSKQTLWAIFTGSPQATYVFVHGTWELFFSFCTIRGHAPTTLDYVTKVIKWSFPYVQIWRD